MNALVSLHQIYDIPALLVISWRGEGGPGGNDAPEHIIMGDVMRPLLDLLRIPFVVFEPSTLAADLGQLTRTMHETRKPVALVVGKGRLQS
jgi:phosphonopyruvate decarboxylase